MLSRDEIERIVLDELSKMQQTDPKAAEAARREIEADEQADELMRQARERRGH